MADVPETPAQLADVLMGLARSVEAEGHLAAGGGQAVRLEAIATRLRVLSGLQAEKAKAATWAQAVEVFTEGSPDLVFARVGRILRDRLEGRLGIDERWDVARRIVDELQACRTFGAGPA